MSEKDYTFVLKEKTKFRYNAGPYDQGSQTPKYQIEVSIPKDFKSQIEIKQFLMGEEGSRIWVWDIENKSTWPALITIKKDGMLVKEI